MWGYKIDKPDAMDFDLLARIDIATRTGGQILWDDIEYASEEELAEEQREREEYDAKAARAYQGWLDGECCGETEWLQRHGFCTLACGGCYRHGHGIELARSEWKSIDRGEADDHLSPWNRSREWMRMKREMERWARGHGKEITGRSDGIEPEGTGGEVQRVDGPVQGPVV